MQRRVFPFRLKLVFFSLNLHGYSTTFSLPFYSDLSYTIDAKGNDGRRRPDWAAFADAINDAGLLTQRASSRVRSPYRRSANAFYSLKFGALSFSLKMRRMPLALIKIEWSGRDWYSPLSNQVADACVVMNKQRYTMPTFLFIKRWICNHHLQHKSLLRMMTV